MRHSGLTGFWPFRLAKEASLKYLRKRIPESVKIDGHIIYLDSSDRLELSVRGSYESFETEIFKKYVKSGDIVLDIGAHIGYYTLIAARIVGDAGRVISFEPEPENFSLLKKNVEANGYKNVSVSQKAVSNQTGGGSAFFIPNRGAGVFLYQKHWLTDNPKEMKIETVKVDDYLQSQGIKAVNFIKMDVEGYEDKAVAGMESVLKSGKPLTMLCEFSADTMARNGADPLKHLLNLRDAGSEIYSLDEGTKKLEKLGGNLSALDMNNITNLLCVRK